MSEIRSVSVHSDADAYAQGLREAGFDAVWVGRGVQRIDDLKARGLYLAFGPSVVRALLALGGRTYLRDYELRRVIARVEAEEFPGARMASQARCGP